MKQNETILVPKIANNYSCQLCNYNSSRKSQYDRHLSTVKHKETLFETNETKKVPKSSTLQCINCGFIFSSRTTLWRHKNKCQKQLNCNITPELVLELIKDNKEMRQIILEQNNTISNFAKNPSITNTNASHNNINNNNKTFNLQFFLNETCKDAMNLMDFVDSIKIQLCDLEKFGELNYVDGISNIITSNLKALDITQRPVHCTDKKRETMYIKDENKWEKEDDNKTKLRKAIKAIANKNLRLLPKFRETYPDYSNSSSKISDKYDKMVIEAMGGLGKSDIDNEDKIINNISKCSIIEKYSENI